MIYRAESFENSEMKNAAGYTKSSTQLHPSSYFSFGKRWKTDAGECCYLIKYEVRPWNLVLAIKETFSPDATDVGLAQLGKETRACCLRKITKGSLSREVALGTTRTCPRINMSYIL